jgi:hypothetical protein
MLPRILADFNMGDELGRVILATKTAEEELHSLGKDLKPGTRVLLYVHEKDFEVEANLIYDPRGLWLAVVDNRTLRYLDEDGNAQTKGE